MTKAVTRAPREGEREVIEFESTMRPRARGVGTDAIEYERGEGGRLMDPIEAELADAERAAAMPSRAGVSASALLFEPENKPWRSIARVVSFADGPIDPEKASLDQTIRVDADGSIEYGVVIGPHDGRVRRTFV